MEASCKHHRWKADDGAVYKLASLLESQEETEGRKDAGPVAKMQLRADGQWIRALHSWSSLFSVGLGKEQNQTGHHNTQNVCNSRVCMCVLVAQRACGILQSCSTL